MDERLTLRAGCSGGRFGAVRVASSRRVLAASGLAGQSVDRALSVLPMIYALCRRAQGIAAARAVEAAAGLVPSPEVEAVRRLLLAAEAVQELWTSVFMDWPGVLGLPSAVEPARRLRSILEPLWRGGPPAGLAHLPDALAPYAPGLEDGGLEAVHRFAHRDQTPAGAVVRYLMEQGLEGFGASDIPPLPGSVPSGEADLVAALAGPQAATFVASPTWNGGPAETGPLARQWTHPTVAAVRAAYGTGLLARAIARVADLDAQLRVLHDTLRALWQTGLGAWPVEPPGLPPDVSGQGGGRAEAARGMLVHWVDLVDGRVRDWRILAPTEWNFHADGPLTRGLEGAPAGDAPAQRLRLMALLLDPCVAFDVVVEAPDA